MGFIAVTTYRSRTGSKEFVYITEPEFEWAEKVQVNDGDGDLHAGDAASGTRRGGLILMHETIYKTWQATETTDLHSPFADKTSGSNALGQRGLSHDLGRGPPADELDNTDFADSGRNEGLGEGIEPRTTRDIQHGPVRGQQTRPDRIPSHSTRGDDFTGSDFAGLR